MAADKKALAMQLMNELKENNTEAAKLHDRIEKFLVDYIGKCDETNDRRSKKDGKNDILTIMSVANKISDDHEEVKDEKDLKGQLAGIDIDEFLDSVENDNNFSKYSTAGQEAEWIPPKVILTHEPGNEIDVGLFHPAAALYECAFDANKCILQHRNMRSQFEKLGCNVLTTKDVLINIADINKLRLFAMSSMIYDLTSIIDIKERKKEMVLQKEYMKNLMNELSRETLTQIIMLRPKVILSRDNKNTYFLADYEISPLMNLIFMRDTLITTKKGIVINAMNSKQRYDETKLTKFIIEQLGYKILLDVNAEAEKFEKKIEAKNNNDDSKESNENMIGPRVEGGDFISCGDYALIGQGLRTNNGAIKLMMDNDVFGTKYVVVVKDEWCDQQEMHLDTYFNIAGKNVCVMSEWRKNGIKNGQKYNTLVDMYCLNNINGKYVKSDKYVNYDFYTFLIEVLKFNVILVSEDDQAEYGINFLCVGDNKIIACEGSSKKYMKELKDAGIDAKYVDVSAMRCTWGAIHCTTQPLVRSN